VTLTTSVKLGDARPTVAYVVSRFPKLTETFILYEILAVERKGVRVEIFPLLRARRTATHVEGAGILAKLVERIRTGRGEVLMHPEAAELVRRAHYAPFMSRAIFGANWRALRRNPGRYLRTLAILATRNLGSVNYLLGGLAIFPKAVFFAEQVKTLGVMHIHAHFANHPAAAAWVMARLNGIPFTFTAHGADLQVDQHMLCQKAKDALRVITVSKHNREFILQMCGERLASHVTVIHCGVDTGALRPRAETKKLAGRRAQPLRILCIGTMYEVKGHRFLVEACRILVERGLEFECRLVGDGPLRQDLEDRVQSTNLGARVLFEGERTRAEVMALIDGADVLVLPSIPTASGRREGIPVVLMEAMASGLAVIASGISGIPELVADERSGLLVAPRDPEAIANAVMRLAVDPDLRDRLVRAARRTIETEFDLDANAGALLATMWVRA
jgi:glycosyltransferase involved in cell wall biosynthesis